MNAALAVAIVEGLIHAITTIVESLKGTSDWDSIRGRLRTHQLRLDQLLRDAQEDLDAWKKNG